MKQKIFIPVCVFLLSVVHAQNTWVPTSGSDLDWSTPSSWSPSTIPNAIDAEAVFGTPSNDLSISLSESITLGSLDITNNSGYDFSVNSGLGGDLILESGSSTSTVTVSGNGDVTNRILAPISLQNTVEVTVNNTVTTSSAGALELSGPVSGSGGLTKAGAGTLSLAGSNHQTYTGATLVNEGRLRIEHGASMTSTSEITVSSGAQLQLVGDAGAEWDLGDAEINLGAMEYDQTPSLILSGDSTSDFQVISNDINLPGLDGSAIYVDSDANYVLGGNVGGGWLVKQGGGLLQLTPTDTFITDLTIQSGNVHLTASNVLNPGGYIAFGDGGYGLGKLSLAGAQTVGGLISIAGSNSSEFSYNEVTSSSGAVLTIDTYSDEVFVFGDGSTQNSGVISGDISIIKTGIGTQILGGENTYTGTTTIQGGVLVVNGSAGTGGLFVSGSGVLGGIGTITTETTIQTGGTHSPGNSPGLQAFEDGIAYNTGAVFEWELFANGNDVLDRGIVYDGVDVTGGTLSIQSGVTASLVFNALTDDLNSSVNWQDDFWDEDRSWLVFQNINAPSLAIGDIFSSISTTADSMGAMLQSVRPNAGFSWGTDENDIYLTYSAIPEPASLVLMMIFMGVSCLGLRLKRRNVSDR